MSEKHGQALDDSERLKALRRSQLLDSPVESSFDKLSALASKLTDSPMAMVSLVEPHRQFIKSGTGLPESVATLREIPIHYSFCQHVVTTGDALVIEDTRLNALVCDNPSIAEYNVLAYLGIPLVSADGWNFGAFCVLDTETRLWTDDEIETMTILAESVTREMQLRLEAVEKEELVEQLQIRNQDLDAFSHTVSHNLKNSISAIIGWADVSTRYADRMSQDDMLESMDKIRQLADSTNDTINSLLLLASVDSLDEVETKALRMSNVLEDALTRFELDIQAQDAMIILPEMFPDCVGYREWVEEVWVNYISNALKYGGNPPKIEFGAYELAENQVCYWIKDNGEGISAEEQKNLFKTFSRLDRDSTIPGHGLGLSIVKRIVDKLGGDVGVESKVGEGSIFSFTLPAK